jgi:hypothetical protein
MTSGPRRPSQYCKGFSMVMNNNMKPSRGYTPGRPGESDTSKSQLGKYRVNQRQLIKAGNKTVYLDPERQNCI